METGSACTAASALCVMRPPHQHVAGSGSVSSHGLVHWGLQEDTLGP